MTVRDQIEAALKSLPVLGERRHLIPSETDTLYLSASFASINDLPRAKKVGGKAARGELEALAKLSYKLGRQMLSMHRDSLAAIEAVQGDAMHPLMLVDEIKKLLAAIDRAEVASDDRPRGAPAKNQARETTLAAARAYHVLTGQNATSSGAFVPMLSKVFGIMKINASAQAQAKIHLLD